MKKAPSLINFRFFENPETFACVDNKWVPARPIGNFSIINRIKLAWKVFKGEYDALKWEKQ